MIWMYHKSEGAKLFSSDDDIDALKSVGWEDTPFDHPSRKSDGDHKDFENLSKDDLLLYAIEHFDQDLDGRKSRENLIAEIKKLHEQSD